MLSLNPNVSFSDIKKVLIIHSAPRSGSSLLYLILRRHPDIYSLNGEGVPFYKLCKLSSDMHLSDEIPEESASDEKIVSQLSWNFLSDLVVHTTGDHVFDDQKLFDQYTTDLMLRFTIQWPNIDFSPHIFYKSASEALKKHKCTSRIFKTEDYYLHLIEELHQFYPSIDPYLYDISEEKIRRFFPHRKVSIDPDRFGIFIEEPLYVLISPNKKPSLTYLKEKTLLLKTSADSYRTGFIKKLFPNADVRYIYLTRNPAAAINGLYDGWLHRGFFSHNLQAILSDPKFSIDKLNIKGYSDIYDFGGHWWNYDLPPCWEDFADRDLEEVCKFQWYSANIAIQNYFSNNGKLYLSVKYEDIVRDSKSRQQNITRILEYSGLALDGIDACRIDELPLVQSTEYPIFFRWRRKDELILPQLKDPSLAATADAMGYNNMSEWL